MKLGRLTLLLLIILIIFLMKPGAFINESKRLWEQRDRILRVTVFVLGIYLLYGFTPCTSGVCSHGNCLALVFASVLP
ncbi:MAG: hypothetical protein HC802_20340 [Caldilineaceae bacterium]|nr:hypothetical protein [Caldilineaceae bacterium]